MKILFSSKDHKYTSGDKIFTSVSKLVSLYKNEFDSEYWSVYKALQRIYGDEEFKRLKGSGGDLGALIEQTDSVILNNTIEEIKQEWKDKNIKSIDKGNLYHMAKEQSAYKRGYEINPFDNKEYPIIGDFSEKEEKYSIIDNLYDLQDGFYAELLMWNDQYSIAGQSDKIFIETIDDKRYIDVDDFKGLALDTEIPTPGGWVLMRDIKTGDEVFDGKGNVTRVKHVSDIHYNPCYKIRFDNNVEIIADHEHKWVISSLTNTFLSKDSYSSIEMTTESIFDYYSKYKQKLAIEINSINTNKKNLPIDPYVLGLWLADGNRTCGTITCVNNNIWNEIRRRGYNISEDHNKTQNRAQSRTIYGISPELRKLNLISNKHIPDIYLRADYNQRLDLLRGYMDGDGYYNNIRNRFVMQTTSIQQASDIQTLVCSLGYKSTIIPYKAMGFGKENIQAYTVGFTMDHNPFLMRNIDIPLNIPKRNHNYIKSIEKIDVVPTRCIAVESPEKTYMATRAFIVTHNTNNKISTYGFKGQRMKAPLSHMQDCNHSHYNLQISAYAWLMEQFGFIPRNLSFHHYNKMYKLDYKKEEVENMILFKD